MKRVMCMFFLLALSLLGTAVAQNPEVRVGILTDGISDFWSAVREHALAKAAEAGAQLDFRMPGQPCAATQQELILQMRETGVAALAVAPISPVEQKDALAETAAVMPLVTLRKDAPDSGRRCFIGRDEVQTGKKFADIINHHLPPGLKLMVFCDNPDLSQNRRRLEGFKQGLESTETILEEVKADHGDRMLAWANAEEVLAQRAEIAALVGFQDYHASALLRAARERGRLNWVKIVLFGSDAETMEALKQGSAHGTVMDDPEAYATTIVSVLKQLADGTFQVPDGEMVAVPPKAVMTDESKSTGEMMHELQVHVPWISEALPGNP